MRYMVSHRSSDHPMMTTEHVRLGIIIWGIWSVFSRLTITWQLPTRHSYLRHMVSKLSFDQHMRTADFDRPNVTSGCMDNYQLPQSSVPPLTRTHLYNLSLLVLRTPFSQGQWLSSQEEDTMLREDVTGKAHVHHSISVVEFLHARLSKDSWISRHVRTRTSIVSWTL